MAIQLPFSIRGCALAVCCGAIGLMSTPGTAQQDVGSILARMTQREKIGQMILVYHSPYRFLAKHAVGGVLIMQSMVRDPARLRAELDTVQKRLDIPLLVTIDQEGGRVNRLSPLKRWRKVPSAEEFSGWPTDSITRYWSEVAQTLRNLNINTNLAPVLDPARNADGRPTFMAIRQRSFGSGRDQIVVPATAFSRAFANNGTLCIAKHFPGYDAETNSDHDIAVSRADSTWVASCVDIFRELKPYVAGVMMSSIQYSSLSRKPAVFSPRMVQWAREALDEVVVMTDDLWGTALRSYAVDGADVHPVHYPDSAFRRLVEEAVRAGNDMLMITFPRKVPTMIQAIEQQAQREPGIREHIDNAARRILICKQRLGLL